MQKQALHKLQLDNPVPPALGASPSWRARRVVSGSSPVLIVDDDPSVAPLVASALSPYRIRTESAVTGGAALAALQERTFSLVVLDLLMPGPDGIEVLRRIREEFSRERLPLLILTGDATSVAMAMSFGYGADDFVRKPFNTEELGLRVYRLIHRF